MQIPKSDGKPSEQILPRFIYNQKCQRHIGNGGKVAFTVGQMLPKVNSLFIEAVDYLTGHAWSHAADNIKYRELYREICSGDYSTGCRKVFNIHQGATCTVPQI